MAWRAPQDPQTIPKRAAAGLRASRAIGTPDRRILPRNPETARMGVGLARSTIPLFLSDGSAETCYGQFLSGRACWTHRDDCWINQRVGKSHGSDRGTFSFAHAHGCWRVTCARTQQLALIDAL